MKKETIILVGGGGYCKECIDVIEAENKYKIAGIVDLDSNVGKKVMGYSIISNDEGSVALIKDYKNFLITVGQIKNNRIRAEKFYELKKNGAFFPVIISPSAQVSRNSFIGEGTILKQNVVICSDVKIGKNCIINIGALVAHESSIGDNTHVSSNVSINGQCKVGGGVFIGSGSVLFNNIEVCSDVIIGAGSVVFKSIKEPGTYIGNPVSKL